MAKSHKCEALECEEYVREPMLFCRNHWFMLPEVVRQAVVTNDVQSTGRQEALINGIAIIAIKEKPQSIAQLRTREDQISKERNSISPSAFSANYMHRKLILESKSIQVRITMIEQGKAQQYQHG
jgi:hypothetical protein